MTDAGLVKRLEQKVDALEKKIDALENKVDELEEGSVWQKFMTGCRTTTDALRQQQAFNEWRSKRIAEKSKEQNAPAPAASGEANPAPATKKQK